MSKLIDLTGQRFGRLTVIERAENDKRGQPRWSCVCECGVHTIVYGAALRKGDTRSCGCLQRETVSRMIKEQRSTHGMSGTRLHHIWGGMIQRCTNPHDARYKWYGAIGVAVCDEWKRFEPFAEWALANGYQENLSLDRIDANSNYCPENCRWADAQVQANNKRNSRLLSYNGKTQTFAQWAKELSIPYGVITHRFTQGWTTEEILLTPLGKLPKGYQRKQENGFYVTYNGETKLLAQWAKELNVSYSTLYHRIVHYGYSIEEALTTPVDERYSRKKK